MVEPISATLAAIALVKAGLEHASDFKDIAGSLDNLFSATEDKPKKPKKKLPKTRMQQLLRMKSGDADYDDETSISSVASDILEQKQNERALHNLGVEIDNKWGRGTFDLIKEERAKRLAIKDKATEKAKAAAKERKEADAAMWNTIYSYVVGFLQVCGIIIVTCVVGYLIWINRCVDETC